MGEDSERNAFEDTFIILHRTMVQMEAMRRSIEAAQLHVDKSRSAIRETCELLWRLKSDGF